MRKMMSVRLGVSLTALLMASGAAAQASAQTAPSSQVDTVEEVIVVGIKKSIQQSLNDKRNAATVSDVITAEDIGKLPDNNVAESLSRVPGVQISRRDGDGSTFTVRGISQNRLEINGRTFIGPSESGAPALEALNPEILSGLEVIKAPSADMTEGALGAIVNLKTKRPLDMKPFVLSGRLEGVRSKQADDLGFRTSALISKSFADDTMGVLLSGAYTDAKTTGYLFDTSGWTRTSAIDATGDGVADANLFRPNRLMQTIVNRRDQRLTFNGAFQYKPTEHFELVLEGTHSDLKRQRDLSQYQGLLNNAATGAKADADGTITSASFSGITLRPLVYDVPTRFKTTSLGAWMKWSTDDDRLAVTADGSYSKGVGNDGAPGSPFAYVVVPRAGRTANVAYDVANGSKYVPNTTYSGNYDLNDPAQYQLLSVFDGEGPRRNKGYDGRVDLDYRVNAGPINLIEVGARYEKTELFSAALQNLPTAVNLLAGRDTNGDGVLTVNELPGISYGNQLGGGYYGGVSGNFPRSFLTGLVDKDIAREAFRLPQLTLFGPITQGPTSVKAVEEKNQAAYVKANFEGDAGGLSYRGNAGLRYVETDRLASGYLSATQPISTKTKFDFWLPSANLTVDLREDLLFRLAAAKVVSRPNLIDVGPGFSPNTTNNTGSRGNPNLAPFQATQYDATLEWYFAPASLLSAAIFRKDVKSFTVITVTQEFVPGFSDRFGLFNISQPQNGSDGRVQGFEVNYQQAFTFLPGVLKDLGVQTNYTYADSKTPLIDNLSQARLPLPGLSKNSYSLVGYYDNGRLSGRLAYTWRSKYLVQVQQAVNAGSRYNDAFGQLDASASFNLNDNLRFTFEAQNLTKEVNRQFDGVARRLSNSAMEDRRVYFGVGLTF